MNRPYTVEEELLSKLMLKKELRSKFTPRELQDLIHEILEIIRAF